MLDIVKKAMLAGIGIALKTKEDLEAFVKELVKKGELSEKEGKKLLDEFLKKYDETKKKLEERVEKKVKEVLKKSDVATRDELKELKNEILKLKEMFKKGSDE
jgi:polyhydroxyalkanoate synthesis regulator phasin